MIVMTVTHHPFPVDVSPVSTRVEFSRQLSGSPARSCTGVSMQHQGAFEHDLESAHGCPALHQAGVSYKQN